MKISINMTAAARSISGGAATSATVKQIKKLEKRKKELMKELGISVGKSTAPMNSANLAKAAFKMGTKPAQPKTSGDEASASANPYPNVVGGGVDSANLQSQVEFTQQLASSGDFTSSAAAGGEKDPKEIMKQIQLIDGQIMALKMQLSKKEQAQLAASEDDEDEDEEDGGDGTATISIDIPDAGGGEVEAVSSVEGGHVDGYA